MPRVLLATTVEVSAAPALVRNVIESSRFEQAMTALIVLNAVTLGLETSPEMASRHGGVLHAIDRAALFVFVAELAARFFVFRTRFFHDPWRVFDFFVVGIALMPSAGAFSVLRALRIL
ncbi:MAG TPA: ion transporter, partial [Vicinamibacteria bacterium]|nr:ion transporter [Vicinamibacteria bacterium]